MATQVEDTLKLIHSRMSITDDIGATVEVSQVLKLIYRDNQ